jgi:hypothetical protein
MNEYEEMTRPVLDALFESTRVEWVATTDALRAAEKAVTYLRAQADRQHATMGKIWDVVCMIDEQNEQPLY